MFSFRMEKNETYRTEKNGVPNPAFYNKEQMQKYKFEIWVSKLFYFYPRKSAFLVFEEKHTTKIVLPVSALIQL